MNLIAHTSSWFGLSDSQQKEEAKKRGGAGKYRREKRSFPPAAAAMFFVVGLIPAGASKIECKLLPFPESYALASTSSSSSTYSLQHATSSTSYLCVQPPLQTLKLATTHIRSTPLVAQSFYFEKNRIPVVEAWDECARLFSIPFSLSSNFLSICCYLSFQLLAWFVLLHRFICLPKPARMMHRRIFSQNVSCSHILLTGNYGGVGRVFFQRWFAYFLPAGIGVLLRRQQHLAPGF